MSVQTIPKLTRKLDEREKVLIPFKAQKVACGLFGISEDFIEKYQTLDSRFVKNKQSTFFFEASGDSMSPTITSGEILVVDRSLINHNQKVCIVSFEGGLICKRVFLKRDHIILHSDNRNFSPIRIDDPHAAIIWGVVIAKASEIK